MSLRIDRELTLAEKSSLRLHLMLCRYCRRCEKQMDMLHRITARRRERGDEEE
ncbi:hypothetical protein ADIMK_4163 [Marinobacterium lacunae]|uniref:Putative zinc-finger domain-containing protein n=2 Tax=Marinobacterium lacunae TaxID=1232683 RepID=A0A081FT51_9GAMM|nr:hypothetical protein ADIMK_4163 [Marinobacterium lacunae]